MDEHVLELFFALRGLENGPDFDIVLKCKDGEIGAHSLILKARSEVFRAMLTAGFADSFDRVIDLSKYSVKSVTALKKYIYTGWKHDIERKLSIQELFELYELADMYMFIGFKKSLKFDLEFAASQQSAIDILNCIDAGTGHVSLNDRLESLCLQFMSERLYFFPEADISNASANVQSKILTAADKWVKSFTVKK